MLLSKHLFFFLSLVQRGCAVDAGSGGQLLPPLHRLDEDPPCWHWGDQPVSFLLGIEQPLKITLSAKLFILDTPYILNFRFLHSFCYSSYYKRIGNHQKNYLCKGGYRLLQRRHWRGQSGRDRAGRDPLPLGPAPGAPGPRRMGKCWR